MENTICGEATDKRSAMESKTPDCHFKPVADRVLIQREKSETKTPGGIIIPDSHKDKPGRGKVIAVGPGHRQKDGSVIPLTVNPGDTVVFGQWSGTDVKFGDETYVIMKEDEILSVITE